MVGLLLWHGVNRPQRGLQVQITGLSNGQKALVTVTDTAERTFARAGTDSTGSLAMDVDTGHELSVQVIIEGPGDTAAWTTRLVRAAQGDTLVLDYPRNFDRGPLIQAQWLSPRPDQTPARPLIPETPTRSVLEIDRVDGVPRIDLRVQTTAGVVTPASALAPLNLDVTCVWSDIVPPGRVGTFNTLDLERLDRMMDGLRDSVPRDQRHLHVLLVPWAVPHEELSLLLPSGAASLVAVDPNHLEPAVVLHAILHEVGHQLGLTHPWEGGTDVRSPMTYPWRWPDWRWDDPEAYRYRRPAAGPG